MVVKSICGTDVTCLVLNTNEPLFSFDDSVKLIFNKALWSSEVKRRQKYSYANLLHNFSSFLKIYIYDSMPTLFFTTRGLVYFINDLIIKHQYPDNNLLETFLKPFKNNHHSKGSKNSYYKFTEIRLFIS